ncbi:MAG: hypothetical protein ACE5JN_15830 [Candidatus Methylomirabilia bacterium]
MSDFHRASVFTTFHRLGSPNLETLESELERITLIRPVTLVLPCLYSELETPGMPRIAEELKPVSYLLRDIQEIGLAIRPDSKGRPAWLAYGYVVARSECHVMGLHGCDIASEWWDINRF